MPITEADIKLVESERMADTSDGGGRRTTRVVPDGVAGNVFPKVSRLDSVYGRVNARKVYGWVDTADLDVYAGAHAIITDAPDNDRIHATIFSTNNDFDTRTQARDRIESYVIAGPESRMRLYGRQLMGQQAVAVYQRPEEPLPEIGEVVCLSHEQGGVTIKQQFIRITDLTHDVRTYEDSTSTLYQRRVIVLKISSVLRYEFVGDDVPVRILSQGTATAKVRSTTVADASRYYGIRPLTAALDVGAMELQVDGVYSPLVPTTQREAAVSMAQISGATVRRSAGTVTADPMLPASNHNGTHARRVARPVMPGTFEVHLVELGNVASRDDGAGNIVSLGGGLVITGTIDYESGQYSLTAAYGGAPWIRVVYEPAAEVAQPAHTRRIPITLATRGTVYAETLLPVPAPGTTILDYRVGVRWYRLRDIGGGVIEGDDPAYGAGTIDYITGALVVTLGALPEVDSAVLLSWGSPVHVTPRSRVLICPPSWQYTLAHRGIEPGSLTIEWEQTLRDEDGVVTGSEMRTISDDTVGRLTGDGAGRINYVTGELWFIPSQLPDPSTTPVATYEIQTELEEIFTPVADGNGMFTVTLAGAPVVPRSVEVLWQTVREKTRGERAGSVENNVAYVTLPDPAPPPAPSPSPSPAPASPTEPVETRPKYPAVGATAMNAQGLPVKFRPVNLTGPFAEANRARMTSGYHVDVASGTFVVLIPPSQTTWGGVTIDPVDLLPTVTLSPSSPNYNVVMAVA